MLKNYISTLFRKGFLLIFNDFNLLTFRIVHINISWYLVNGRDEGKS